MSTTWEPLLKSRLGVSEHTLRDLRKEFKEGVDFHRGKKGKVFWTEVGITKLELKISGLSAVEGGAPAPEAEEPAKTAPAPQSVEPPPAKIPSGEEDFPILAEVAGMPRESQPPDQVDRWNQWPNQTLVGARLIEGGEPIMIQIKTDYRTMFRPRMLVGVRKHMEPNYYVTRKPKKVGVWSFTGPTAQQPQ